MNLEAAKSILLAIHRGDGGITTVGADTACQLLEDNLELQSWFGAECAELSPADQALADSLWANIEVPASLRSELNAIETTSGGATSSVASSGPSSKLAQVQQAGTEGNSMVRFLLPTLAAAAALVVGFVILDRLKSDPSDSTPIAGGEKASAAETIAATQTGESFEDFRKDMANFAVDGLALQQRADKLPQISQWLAERDSPFGEMPEAIAGAKSLGCAVVRWGEANVSLVCFRNSANETVHLFVADLSQVAPGAGELELSKMVAANDLDTASWSANDKAYLLVGAAPGVSVDSLL